MVIAKIIEALKTNLEENTANQESAKLLRQCYISLRNSVAIHKSIQNHLANDNIIINLTEKLIPLLQANTKEEWINCLIMLLQFLGNLVVSNETAQLLVWTKFKQHLLVTFQPSPTRLPAITGMILYNIFLENNTLIPNTVEFVSNVVKLLEAETEYSLLMMELIIKFEIINSIHSNLKIEDRLIVLDLIHDMIPYAAKESIPESYILILVDDFKKKSDCILKTVTDYLNNIEPLEVVRLLDILTTASSLENYRSCLQNDKSLLINAVFLLKSIHNAGKESNNHFTAIQKLSELSLDNTKSDLNSHPAFGFKAALIRLVGNLVWQCKKNQDLLRELEGIALLLDCCNIDARNPFIIQCVIVAIRGICEGNKENQEVIAAMTKVGTIDSKQLMEMGLVLNDDGDKKICVMPYEKK